MTAGRTRPFDDLTPRGQLLRLRALALEALRAYDVEVTGCSFVATAFNTVFRVDTTNGPRALRMSPRLRIHADGCELAEAEWVNALRDTGFPTPRVMPARDGSAVVWVSAENVPEPRSCVLFEWVGGRPLREKMSTDLFRRTGELAARVHDHAASYVSSPPSGVLVADRVCYFRAQPRLEELRSAYGAMFDEALVRAQAALDELWGSPPHPAHLLHGDVQPGNVMVARNRVTLIDFQDLIWGFEIQDVQIALQAIADAPDVDALTSAFRAGYEAIRPWPNASPETVAALHATRHLNVLNFGLSVRKPGLDAFVARHAHAVAEWMNG
jgi:Ser/Thr protein kinase RdoA (MazF antagonist)